MALNPLAINSISRFIGYIAPLLVMIILFAISLFSNQYQKGFVYLGGVILASAVTIGIMNILKKSMDPTALYVCNMFSIPWANNYSTPSLSTSILTFTLVYLLFPMIVNNQINVWVIVFFSGMLLMDAISKLWAKCINLLGIASGIFIGAGVGVAYYGLVYQASPKDANSKWLFFSELLSNKVMCSRPSSQQFKCSVKTGSITAQ